MIMLASGGNETRTFGNYCLSPSGGLTLGFWSNKNGNKLLTGNANGTGTTLLPAVVTLLNSCQLVNANGSVHIFTNSYSAVQNLVAGRHRDEHGLHAVGAVGSVEAGRQLRVCGRQRV